jgi:hypothetical protein
MYAELTPQPRVPAQISEYAHACLTALAEKDLGKHISLGGAFGLSFYYDYRPTHDIDAWWEENISENDRQAVAQCVQSVLETYGTVRTRSWGHVTSIELIPTRDDSKIFSFQIADRSARLEKSLQAPLLSGGLRLDSFTDILASKMVALVERGSPRDFRDIHAVCQAGLTNPKQCWQLWQRRQTMAGTNPDQRRAILAIQTHLTRIALQRPLDKIHDQAQRQAAAQLRSWFEEVFENVLMD